MVDLTIIERAGDLPLDRLNQLITASPHRFVLILDACELEDGGAGKLCAIADAEPQSILIVPSLDGATQYLGLAQKGHPSAYLIAVNRFVTRVGRPYVQDLASHAQIICARCEKRNGEMVHTSAVNASSL